MGAIGIITQNPIPIVQYGDHYTWAKYGYHVLQPNIEPNCRSGEINGYCKALRCLLMADLYQMEHFQIEIHINSVVDELLEKCIPDDTPLNEKGTQFDMFFAEHVTKTEALFLQLQQIATQATVIPLSVFTNLLHQRFPKHRFLESTLELLQQFYLCVEAASDDTHHLFPWG